MSNAEIADNKWEVQAAKPPIYTAAAVSQLIMIGALAFIFLWLIKGSLEGLVSERKDGLAEAFGKMNHEAAPAAGAAPAAAAAPAPAPAK